MGREAWAADCCCSPPDSRPRGACREPCGLPRRSRSSSSICQARLLQAAKGIPAWREPLLVPLVVTTGLAEGGGLFFAAAPWHQAGTPWLLAGFGALVLARVLVWLAYRRNLAHTLASGATEALDRAGRVLQIAGTRFRSR